MTEQTDVSKTTVEGANLTHSMRALGIDSWLADMMGGNGIASIAN